MHQFAHGNQLQCTVVKVISGAKKQKRSGNKALLQNEGTFEKQKRSKKGAKKALLQNDETFEKQGQRHEQKLAERRASANACLAQFSLFRSR